MYVGATSGYNCITATGVAIVAGHGDEVQGVWGADYNLNQLSSVLVQSLAGADGAWAYVVERSGHGTWSTGKIDHDRRSIQSCFAVLVLASRSQCCAAIERRKWRRPP